MNDELTIRQTRPSDIETVIAILEEAAAKATPMWPLVFRRQPIADAIIRGEVYLAALDGQTVGTLTLQWSDTAVWGNMPDDAGYVHKLAVRRGYAGRGIGRRMLAWAEAHVAMAGRQFVRLDCIASNPALRAYYERAGYTYRGEAGGAEWRASLFEKRV